MNADDKVRNPRDRKGEDSGEWMVIHGASLKDSTLCNLG